MSEIDFFFNSDGEEEIKRCLSCEREDCINCLSRKEELRDRPYMSRKARKVDQYSLDGTFIRTWPTLTEASRSINTYYKIIGRACRRGNYPVGGYIWRFHEED